MKLLRKNCRHRNETKRKKELGQLQPARDGSMWKKIWCWVSMIKVCSLLYLMVKISFSTMENNFPIPILNATWNGIQWYPFHHIPLLTYILVTLQFRWNGMEPLITLFVQWLNYKYNLIFITFLLLPAIQLCSSSTLQHTWSVAIFLFAFTRNTNNSKKTKSNTDVD